MSRVVDAPLLAVSDSVPELSGCDRVTGGVCRIRFAGSLTVTNREAACKMAARGLGAALLLRIAAAPELERCML